MRLALLADYPEESWPSMDLCAEMLARHITQARRLYPRFRRAFGQFPWLPPRLAFNADRLFNRHWEYPRLVQSLCRSFDTFHICDHTYAQLGLRLPAGRLGVYCHDLDAFRSILEPAKERRPAWFRALARRTLAGLQRSLLIFHSTQAVRAELLRFGVVPESRLIHAPYGVADEFFAAGQLPLIDTGRLVLLHVGSCIPRKRIDVLFTMTLELRKQFPDLIFRQLGGTFTPEQHKQIARLGLTSCVEQRWGLSRAELAAGYRSASLVCIPSSAEGFGIPVIEALASGARVLASDIPALREAGGDAADYATVGDVGAFVGAACRLLAAPQAGPPRERRLAWASRFTWNNHARIIYEAYARL